MRDQFSRTEWAVIALALLAILSGVAMAAALALGWF